MVEHPDVSVVIPARDAASRIGHTLACLAGERPIIKEIVLVDDASADATAAVARQAALDLDLPLEVIASPARGPGGARNLGLERSTGAFIYLLDADDEPLPGGVRRLREGLISNQAADLAVGASIRRTQGRPDKIKVPAGYRADPAANARAYLRNELWPIAVGSCLIRAGEAPAVRFPEAFGLDEDTCFFAALLAGHAVQTIEAPVLVYHLDEARMSRRHLLAPAATHRAIAQGLEELRRAGVDADSIAWRQAWVALRIARELIRHRRFPEARRMLEITRQHPELRNSWKVRRYGFRSALGLLGRHVAEVDTTSQTVPAAARARRFLVITADPADPPISGADLRNWQNAEAAARLGDVLLASVRPGVERQQGRIRTAALTRPNDPRGRAVNHRRAGLDLRIPRLALERLQEVVEHFRPDTAIIEGIPLHALLPVLRPLVPRLVLDMHNVESLLRSHRPETEEVSANWWTDDSGHVRRRERDALALADRVWVCSPEDGARLERLHRPGIPIDIVPNGIPRFDTLPPRLPPARQGAIGEPVILFVGHLGYGPNADAALRLTNRILPMMRERISDTRLVLAGRHPTAEVLRAARDSGADLVENPRDLAPLMTACDLTVVPLTAGGGTRIKILEAMAWGVPVVATPLAAEGLGLADGYDVTLARSDAELTEAALTLIVDPERRQRQRRRGLETARSRFGPEAIARAVAAGLDAPFVPVPQGAGEGV